MSIPPPSYQIEEMPDKQKITIAVRFRWSLFLVYSLALLAWITMVVVVLIYLLRGMSTSITLTAVLILWLLFWLVMGRFLWNRWQYQAANREIIFIDNQQVVIRRPVSILGLTTAYDIHHVSPIYFSDKHNCPAFDYAYMHVYFGQSLGKMESRSLIGLMNSRLFPELDTDDFAQFS